MVTDRQKEESYMTEQYQVKKVGGPIDWTVSVPGSKSMTNRALLLAALSDGTVEVDGVLFSDDSRHFLGALEALGFSMHVDERKRRVSITGCSGHIPRNTAEIDVGSAGTAARFLTAMLGLSDGVYTIRASEQMKKRPMQPLFALLQELGAEITFLEKENHLPVRIRGCADGGKEGASPTGVSLDISQSTQFLSALLLVSPMFRQGLHVHIVSEKTDGSYIRITRNMMEEFGVPVSYTGRDYIVMPDAGYHRERYTVEPDMSAACYFYAAAAVTGGRALVRHVHADNTQGDYRFLEVLRAMGCAVREEPDGIAVEGPKGGALHGIDVDMNDFSDQALTLAAIAPFADGEVHIRNIGHIRGQECDRIHAIVTELSRLGILCREETDAVTVYPGSPGGGVVRTYEDHRVAMAFSLIGLRADGIVIDNPGCCKKTFEEYFEILDRLCAGGKGQRGRDDV